MTDTADELIAYLRAQGVAIPPRVAVLARRKIAELLAVAEQRGMQKLAATLHRDDARYCVDCGAETDGAGCSQCD